MARYQPRHKRTNTLRKATLGALLIVFVFVVAAILFRTALLEFGLKTALVSQGLGPVEIDVRRLGPTTVQIGPLSFADGQMAVEVLEARYSSNLWRLGQVDSVFISGFHLSGEWTGEGVSFGALDRFFEPQPEQSNEPATSLADDPEAQSTLIDNVVIEDAVVSLQHPDGLFTIETDLSFDGGGEENVITTNTRVQGPNIAGKIQWNGATRNFDALNVIGTGLVHLSANAFRMPGQTETVDIDVDLEIASEDKNFRVDANRPLTIKTALPIDSNLLDGLDQVGRTINVSLSSENEEGSILTAVRRDQGFLVTSDLNLVWTSPLGNGALEFGGWMGLGEDNLPQDFLFERLSLSLENVTFPFGTITASLNGSGMHGPLTVAEGPIQIEALVSNGSVKDVNFDDLLVSANTTFRLDGLSLAFDLNDFTTTMRGGAFGDSFRFDQPVSAVLESPSPSAQFVTVVFGADGSATLTFDAGLKIDAPAMVSITNNDETRINISVSSVAVDGFWVTGETDVDLGIALQGVQVSADLLQGRNLSAEIAGSLDLLNGSLSGMTGLRPISGPVRAGLPFESEIEWTNQQLTLNGVLKTGSARDLATFLLTYDTSQGRGQFSTSVGPLLFGGNQLSPSDIYDFGLPFTPTSGEMAAELALPLGDAPPTNGGTLYARDLEVETGAARLERVNMVLSLEQIWPPLMKKNQTVAIGLLQAGVPITNVLASFSISEPNFMNIPSINMDFAGGQISGYDFTIDLAEGRELVSLDVRGVNLATLAQLSGLSGLGADGVLSGTIPVQLSANDAVIRNGILTTNGSGRISYRPAPGSGVSVTAEGGLQLALQAMEEFQYDSLSLTVSGSLIKELEASLAIKGRNPNLYGGYPVDFNLNLSGELANIVQGSLTGYRVPESIKQQLMAFPSRQ